MKRIIEAIDFLRFYSWEVILSNLRVAHDALTPTHRMKPAILSIDVSGMTPRQLLFMGNLITMTPGTLGLSFSDDLSKFYIHAMYVDEDVTQLSADLENQYGERVRRVF